MHSSHFELIEKKTYQFADCFCLHFFFLHQHSRVTTRFSHFSTKRIITSKAFGSAQLERRVFVVPPFLPIEFERNPKVGAQVFLASISFGKCWGSRRNVAHFPREPEMSIIIIDFLRRRRNRPPCRCLVHASLACRLGSICWEGWGVENT